jgi:hypothetical protein
LRNVDKIALDSLISSEIISAILLNIAPLDVWIKIQYIFPDLMELKGPVGIFFVKVATISSSWNMVALISQHYTGLATLFIYALSCDLYAQNSEIYMSFFFLFTEPEALNSLAATNLSITQFNDIYQLCKMASDYLTQTY